MSRYYNPVRAWWQRRLYRPVEWAWERVPMPERAFDRIAAWLYVASGAGRRSTRREMQRHRELAKALPLTSWPRIHPPASPSPDKEESIQ